MIQTPEDRRPPMTPQLALRVAIVGSVALAFFAIIFFRLWFLQVLSGEQYVHAATVNRVRDVDVPAQRGEILDRTGNRLVDSRQALAVQISPTELPKTPAAQRALYGRLARVLGVSTRPGRCIVPGLGPRRLARIPCDVAKQLAILPYADVTLKTDVPRQVQYYLAERESAFPSVVVQKIYVRAYPLGGLAAQLFGTVGPINPQELASKTFRGVSRNATVGQSGIEYAYDQFLRGTDGKQLITVDAQGRPTGQSTVTAPVAGHNLSLSLSEALQRVGQQSLQRSISSNYPSAAGAFVAMNPQNGQIYAMGSLPTFDPRPVHHREPEPAHLRPAQQPGRPRAAAQPCDRGRRPHRLDLQADHRHRGAGVRRVDDRLDLRRHRLLQGRRADPHQRGSCRQRAARSRRRAQGLLRHLLLQPGRSGPTSPIP